MGTMDLDKFINVKNIDVVKKYIEIFADFLYQNIDLIEEMIKEKKLEDEEKALFRKDYAEPLWEEFKLWTASAILDVPKDSNIYHPERWLCYVLKRIDSTPEDKYYTLLHEFWEDEEQ